MDGGEGGGLHGGGDEVDEDVEGGARHDVDEESVGRKGGWSVLN